MNKQEQTEVKESMINMINETEDFDDVTLIITKDETEQQNCKTLIHGSKLQNYRAITNVADRVLNSLIKDVKDADEVDTLENRMEALRDLCYMGMPGPDIDVFNHEQLSAFMNAFEEAKGDEDE